MSFFDTWKNVATGEVRSGSEIGHSSIDPEVTEAFINLWIMPPLICLVVSSPFMFVWGYAMGSTGVLVAYLLHSLIFIVLHRGVRQMVFRSALVAGMMVAMWGAIAGLFWLLATLLG